MSLHTLSVLVENQPGVLARVANLFSRRGYNIESLAVGPTEREDLSRITLRVDCSQTSLDQVIKQLYKLINVLKVNELRPGDTVERELLLVKVGVGPEKRAELMNLAEVFGARVVDVGPTALVFEIVEHPDRLAAFEEIVRPYGVKELVRAGRVAIQRVVSEQSRRSRLQVLA
jgi:acetolactate synthase-1/3 small subunit